MIGEGPTAGCLGILNQLPGAEAEQEGFSLLHSLIFENTGQKLSSGVSVVLATIGDTHLETLIYALEAQVGTCLFIDFDHEQVDDLACRMGLLPTELFLPYVTAMQKAVGCQCVGIGVEISPPLGMDVQSLRNVGITQYWQWDTQNSTWIDKQIIP